MGKTSTSTSTADSVEVALAKDIGSAVPEVSFVLTEEVPGALKVWIAVDNPEEAVRHQIYAKEMDLIAQYPDIDIDFNLVATLGRAPDEVAQGAMVAYRRSNAVHR